MKHGLSTERYRKLALSSSVTRVIGCAGMVLEEVFFAMDSFGICEASRTATHTATVHYVK